MLSLLNTDLMQGYGMHFIMFFNALEDKPYKLGAATGRFFTFLFLLTQK